MKSLGSTLAAVLMLASVCAHGQVLTDTSDGVLTAVVNFNVNPGTSTNPISQQVQFRIRSDNAAGYNVRASTSFSATPSAPLDGGRTLAASEIGAGITSLELRSQVITPRTDVIATGFNYDPSAVPGINGLTPYTGMASGQATVADLVNNPNLKILNGPQIHGNQNLGPQNYITVTMTFALVPQYFTPGTFTVIITLTIANGQ